MADLNEAETIRVTAMDLAIRSFDILPNTTELIARANRIAKFIKEGVKET